MLLGCLLPLPVCVLSKIGNHQQSHELMSDRLRGMVRLVMNCKQATGGLGLEGCRCQKFCGSCPAPAAVPYTRHNVGSTRRGRSCENGVLGQSPNLTLPQRVVEVGGFPFPSSPSAGDPNSRSNIKFVILMQFDRISCVFSLVKSSPPGHSHWRYSNLLETDDGSCAFVV